MSRKIQHGSVRWQIEWCTDLPIDSAGDADIDQATYVSRLSLTRESAFTMARKVFPQAKLGAVRITQVSFVPYDNADATRYPIMVGYWKPYNDSEWFEGD